MGIDGIHILHEVDDSAASRFQQEQEALIIAHRRGEHPVGEMVRACPLCQAGE